MPVTRINLRLAGAYTGGGWTGSFADGEGHLASSALTPGGLALTFSGSHNYTALDLTQLGHVFRSRAAGSGSGTVDLSRIPSTALLTQLRVTATREGESHSIFSAQNTVGPADPPTGPSAYANVGWTVLANVRVVAAAANIADDVDDNSNGSANQQVGWDSGTQQADVVISPSGNTKTTALASVSKASFIAGSLDEIAASIGDSVHPGDAYGHFAGSGFAWSRTYLVAHSGSGSIAFQYEEYELTWTQAGGEVPFCLSPDEGPPTTVVTLTGEGIGTCVDSILFGDIAATEWTIIDDDTIEVVAPIHPAGEIIVSVICGAVAQEITCPYTYPELDCPEITLSDLPEDVLIGAEVDVLVEADGSDEEPYIYSLLDGDLPDGLTFESDGQLHGTVTTTGTFTFTLRAMDQFGCVGDREYTFGVGCAEITLPAIQPIFVGPDYDFLIEAAGSANEPYTYAVSAGVLPDGLVLETDGQLHGAATTLGAYDFTVEATDAFGCTGDRQYAATIVELDVTQIRGNTQIKRATVTEVELHPSVAGAGLLGGDGVPLAVNPSATGGVQVVGDEVLLKLDPAVGPTLAVSAAGARVAPGIFIRKDGTEAFTADQPMGGFKLTGHGTPVAGTDVANKNYVDAFVVGLTWKQPVRVATAANMVLSGLAAIDGVTPIAGDRVLVKEQVTGADNGIYVAAAGAWARATDADTSAEVKAGMAVYAEEGTAGGDKAYTLTTNNPIVLGTTALVFAVFSGGGGGGGTGDIKSDGTVPFVADQSMGNNRLTNVKDATAAQDAVNVRVAEGISVLTNGDAVNPEIMFDATGDVIMTGI